MECACGGYMVERQENLKIYLRCPKCTRVYAPQHRASDQPGGSTTMTGQIGLFNEEQNHE